MSDAQQDTGNIPPPPEPEGNGQGATGDAGGGPEAHGAGAGSADAQNAAINAMFQRITHSLEEIYLAMSKMITDLATQRQLTIGQREILSSQFEIVRQMQAQLEGLDVTVRMEMRTLYMGVQNGFAELQRSYLAIEQASNAQHNELVLSLRNAFNNIYARLPQ